VAGNSESRPLVLLAGLDPISQLGMIRALRDGGAEVLDGCDSAADDIVRRAAEARPDGIVVGDGPSTPADLGARLRAAARSATLVLWRREDGAVAVLDPGSDSPRVMPAPSAAELAHELFGRTGKGDTWLST
jgi:hypothetical protein